jgi:hypothetical protein
MIFHNVKSIAKQFAERPDYYDAMFVPRMSYYTAYCDLHDMVWPWGHAPWQISQCAILAATGCSS